ncbi:hypothetical protein LPJ61_002026 [Coemansia biformis]|uniref:AAR2-domain-containing protein n=1 Tax=Coemansia biformis TaxID=1286918 RepID=A0A9W7Y915_9FUNG|nr:hypothetical protein LPJ61_002026 [Coemansia biformis]
MEQSTARALFEQGACLVVLDVPPGIEFGIDLDTWETGPLFKGLKMIPPGIHYVHYSAVNNEKQPGMRSGFFHDFKPREVVVRRWSSIDEDLMAADAVGAEDVERVRQNIRDLDRGLGAFQLAGAGYARWQRLTAHITPGLLARVLPTHGCFSSATGSAYEDEEIAAVHRKLQRNAHAMERQGVSAADALAIVASEAAAMGSDAADRFRFTYVDIRHSFPKDAPADEIREHSLDKSWLLRTLLERRLGGPAGLLGEFQLAFLVILAGQNFAGIEHWKRLLHLVMASARALEDQAVVSGTVMPMVHALLLQLAECPREFVASVLQQDGFVAEILCTFVLNVHECPSPAAKSALTPEIARLRTLLASYGWPLPSGRQLQEDADEEAGEYAPQVVEL